MDDSIQDPTFTHVTEHISNNDEEPNAPLVTEYGMAPRVEEQQAPPLTLTNPQKKYKYNCEMCGKSFKDKSKFRRHTEDRKTLCISHNQLVEEIKTLKSQSLVHTESEKVLREHIIDRDTTILQRDTTVSELEGALAGEKKEHAKTQERLNEQIDDALDDGEFITVTLKRTQRSLDKYKHKYELAKNDISKRRSKIIKLKGMYKKLDQENKYLSDKIMQFEYNSD